MFDILDTGASGLQAQRTRLDAIAENIARRWATRSSGYGAGTSWRSEQGGRAC